MTEVCEKAQPELQEVTIQSLLSTGAHYGHTTTSWCPKMAPYLYGTKSVNKRSRGTKNVYIFNLDLTLRLWRRARKAIVDNAAAGGSILFVGTKPQSREIIRREALRSGSPFVDYKWVGGLLTNEKTVRQSINKMTEIENLLAAHKDTESNIRLTKKEALLMQRDLDKLDKKFGGIRGKSAPTMMFVIDTARNHIAIEEAQALDIPIVAITDSNSDPDNIDYIIPANDDATGALNLLISNVADAVLEGKGLATDASMLEERAMLEEYDFSEGVRGAILDPPGGSDPQISKTPADKEEIEVIYKPS